VAVANPDPDVRSSRRVHNAALYHHVTPDFRSGFAIGKFDRRI